MVSFGLSHHCGVPWECRYNEAWTPEEETICTKLNHAWYTSRQDFETNKWSVKKTDLVDTTKSTFHVDMFLGYCKEGGKRGYLNAV